MLSFSRTLACAFALLVSPSFAAKQIYTYRDDSGTQSFTTELDSIPEQYRSRVILLTSDRGSPVGGEHANSPPNLARNDIRSYTAGVVTVVNQQSTARLDGETVIIRVVARRKVDPDQVMQAIAVFRDSGSVSHELNAFQTDTGLLR